APPHEARGRPLPAPAPHTQPPRLYRDALRHLAASRKARFVDLFEDTLHPEGSSERLGGGAVLERVTLTDDGIHLNQRGYWTLGRAVGRQLGTVPRGLATITNVSRMHPGLRFDFRDANLPYPPDPRGKNYPP